VDPTFDIVNRVVWGVDYAGIFVYVMQVMAGTLLDTAAAVIAVGDPSPAPPKVIGLLKTVQVVMMIGSQLLFAPLTWFYSLNQQTASIPGNAFGVIWFCQWIMPVLKVLNLLVVALGGVGKKVSEVFDQVVSAFYTLHGALLFLFYVTLRGCRAFLTKGPSILPPMTWTRLEE